MSTDDSLQTRETNSEKRPAAVERTALAAGGIATVLAGACCLGPLLIVSLGFGGAWLGRLQAFEPFQPLFVVAALAALGWAGWRVHRPAACRPGGICATPAARRAYRAAFWFVAALLVLVLAFPYFAHFFY